MDIALKFVELSVEPIGKQLGYLTFYEKNVKKLKDEVAKLNRIKNALQPRLDVALENGETIDEAVENWKKQVDDANEKAGTFPRRCWSTLRYSLSRKAKKMTLDDVIELQQAGDKFRSGSISNYLSSGWPQPCRTGESSTSDDPNEISFIVNDALETFLKDDQMYMIGIHGEDRVHMKRLVDSIFITAKGRFQYGATAPAKNHDKKDIQDEIAFGLGMTNFSRSNTDPVRHHRLSNRLKDTTKKLILLEDVCEILDLEAIGIPFGKGEWNKTCKIIVTSSDKSICEKMKAQKNYKLEVHQQMLLFGGRSGDLWDDKAHTKITSIIVAYNRTGICSFQTEYDDNGHWFRSPNHDFLCKSTHDNEKKINLEHPDEFLISVSGYLLQSETINHVVLHSLTFKSNKQTFGPFGGPETETGLFFTSTTEAGKIIGFYGKKNSDDSLGALGYYYEESISIPAGPEQPPISIPTGPEQPPISIPAVPQQLPISIRAIPEQPISDFGVSDGSSEIITLFHEGGAGGGPWNDGPGHTTVRLIQLQVGHENVLTGIRIKYDNNDEWHEHGDQSFHTAMIKLDYPSEFLISMSGTTRNLYGWVVISSLEFQSNNNRTFGPFGDTNGDPFSSSPTHSGKIVGFCGKVGAHLDSIGAYFKTSSNS